MVLVLVGGNTYVDPTRIEVVVDAGGYGTQPITVSVSGVSRTITNTAVCDRVRHLLGYLDPPPADGTGSVSTIPIGGNP